MNIPITETREWQTLQHDLNQPTTLKTGNNYQFLALEKHAKIADYLYLPYGPVLNEKAPEKAWGNALAALLTLAQEKSATFIRVEPQNPKIAQILRNSPYLTINGTKLKVQKSKDLNPKDTWVLDLTPDLDELYHGMKQSTRSRCKNYLKKGLSVKTSKDPHDLKYLVKFQSALAKEKRISTFSEDYLKAELNQPFATLYLVSYDPKSDETLQTPPKPDENPRIVAASLFFDDPDLNTRYYMQSASDPNFYNNYPVFYALLIEAIKDAKQKGIKHLDFWGIAPDDADKSHPWFGFTEFKKSFGGSPKHYPGTYDLVLKPTRYKLYKLLRSLHLRLKK